MIKAIICIILLFSLAITYTYFAAIGKWGYSFIFYLLTIADAIWLKKIIG